MDEHVSAKQALRERLLSRRRELRGRDLAQAAGRIRDVVLDALPHMLAGRSDGPPAGTVAAYVSVGSEPGTGPLLDELEARGVQTLLPVLVDDGDLDWARYTGPLGLVPAARGLMEPRARRLGPHAITSAAVVLVPALAVDRRGYRLGRGAGSYDRALTRLVGTNAVIVAVLHDGELLDLPMPIEPHDRRVHAAATPSGLVWLS